MLIFGYVIGFITGAALIGGFWLDYIEKADKGEEE